MNNRDSSKSIDFDISSGAAASRPSPVGALALSFWCGLMASVLEVCMLLFRKSTYDQDSFYKMPRDFIWLIPLVNLAIFLAVGAMAALGIRILGKRISWISKHLLIAMMFSSPLLVAFPQISAVALFVFSLGLSSQVVHGLARLGDRSTRFLQLCRPALLTLAIAPTLWLYGSDYIRAYREAARPLPTPGSPNVLLIVLDTVRADHLSAYNYHRATTPNIDRLAKQGVKFEEARSTSPWSLPSHSSMLTGRWAHELKVGWKTPLDRSVPTLSEYLGSHGYATAGFVANTWYCAYDSGLSRGFVHYEDYALSVTQSLECSSLMKVLIRSSYNPLRPVFSHVLSRFQDVRVHASMINRRFLNWMARRAQENRPFFAFLNYTDAHHPYILPEGEIYRFGLKPTQPKDRGTLDEWWALDKLQLTPREAALGVDSYDSCLAYLDEQLGLLFGELERQDLLHNTLVIVTSDHGEGFGEHDLFCHSVSLYDSEIHVPLIILPPSRGQSSLNVSEAVSLRNLPATVVDVVGLDRDSPFQGSSLVGYWDARKDEYRAPLSSAALSEARSPRPEDKFHDPNHNRSPICRGRVISAAEGDYVYIRYENDGREELYNVRTDPGELRNLASDADSQVPLERLRAALTSSTNPRVLAKSSLSSRTPGK